MIYLDNAATTRTKPCVMEEMVPYFCEYYGNASALYELGGRSRDAMEQARKTIGNILGTEAKNIYFTSGGTESDNWALRSAALALKHRGRHIITTKIEHHAILHTCEFLEEQGFEITYLNVDEYGVVRLNELARAIRKDTILISVMFANNEIGTIQPVMEISRMAHLHGILFHTDAVQAFGHVPISVERYGIDILSASGHKFGGPKGTGFLYIREKSGIQPFLFGGAQERKMRAGTENIPGIVGMACAARESAAHMTETMQKEKKLRDYLVKRILTEIPDAYYNGHPLRRLSNNASFCFRYVDGEALVILLDMEGICASSGSACSAGSKAPSHVLTAIGRPEELVRGSLRLTLSEETTREELDHTVEVLKGIMTQLRETSPEL